MTIRVFSGAPEPLMLFTEVPVTVRVFQPYSPEYRRRIRGLGSERMMRDRGAGERAASILPGRARAEHCAPGALCWRADPPARGGFGPFSGRQTVYAEAGPQIVNVGRAVVW
jgi:hypothetical protein